MKYNVSFNGRTYEVEVEVCEPISLTEFQAIAPAAPVAAAPVATPAAAPASAPAAAASAPAITGAGEAVNAPMPGTILKVNVQNGQAVKAGDVLVVLEAMKMENEILAPKAGTVTQVAVQKGSNVDTGAPLVVIG